jgi:predicted RNA-binding protein with PUA domain
MKVMSFKKYIARGDAIIVALVDENEKIVGFTVCDKNNERYTNRLFTTASEAMEWCDNQHKAICDEN